MSAPISTASATQLAATNAKNALSTAIALERLERLATSFCDLVEAYLRAGEDCVPTRSRDTSETDVAAAMYELRAQIDRKEPDAHQSETYLKLRTSEIAMCKLVLERIHNEVRDYPAHRPHSIDSYLPPHMVAELATVLGRHVRAGAPR